MQWWVLGHDTNLTVDIFLGTIISINVISVKLCMMVVLSEIYLFIPLSMTLTETMEGGEGAGLLLVMARGGGRIRSIRVNLIVFKQVWKQDGALYVKIDRSELCWFKLFWSVKKKWLEPVNPYLITYDIWVSVTCTSINLVLVGSVILSFFLITKESVVRFIHNICCGIKCTVLHSARGMHCQFNGRIHC